MVNHKIRWSEKEIRVLFDNFERFGTRFKMYERVLNRTHS